MGKERKKGQDALLDDSSTLRGIGPVDHQRVFRPIIVQGRGVLAVGDDGGDVDMTPRSRIQLDQFDVPTIRVQQPVAWRKT